MRDFNLVAKQSHLNSTYKLIDTLEDLLKSLRIAYKVFPECRKEIVEAGLNLKKELEMEKLEINKIRKN